MNADSSSDSGGLSPAEMDSLDRYGERLRREAVTPRQWERLDPVRPAGPQYRTLLWAEYSRRYRPPEVAGYAIEDVLGVGGMGRVYLARDLKVRRTVAVKELLAGALDSREADLLAKIDHPNVVPVYDLVGGRFLVMPHLPNGTLEERLDEFTAPAAGYVRGPRLVATLARAVQAAHAAGVIHRDLKPANVLFAADDTPRVADFGLATVAPLATDPTGGSVVGTPRYMAPEQVAGRRPTVASDVWGLGVILYRLLTGGFPFDGRTGDDLKRAAQQQPPRPLPPGVPRVLRDICSRCLEKDHTRRYGSAGELADALDAAVDRLAWRLPRRALLAGGAVAAVGGGAWWLAGRRPPRIEPRAMWDALPGRCTSVAISPDNRFAFCEVTGNRVVALDLARGTIARQKRIGVVPDENTVCGTVAVAADGRRLATISTSAPFLQAAGGELCRSLLRLVDPDNFAELDMVDGTSLFGRPLVLSTDGRWLAGVTAGGDNLLDVMARMLGPEKSHLAVYDLRGKKAGHYTRRQTEFGGPIRCLAFAPAGDLLYVGGDAGVSVWDAAKCQKLHDLSVPAGVDALTMSADGTHLYVGSAAANTLATYTTDGKLVRAVAVGRATAEPTVEVAVNPQGWAVTAGNAGTAIAWDLVRDRRFELGRPGGGRQVTAVAISPDGTMALLVTADLSINVYSLAKK